MFPRILSRITERIKAHKQFGLEFEERGSHTWVFLRTWRKEDHYGVKMGVTGRYNGCAGSELLIPGQFFLLRAAGHL